MATYVERARALISAGINGTPTSAQEQRIAAAFVKYRPDIVKVVANDPENPTGTEMAAVLVEAFRDWGKSVLRAMAEKDAVVANESTVTGAGDTAEGDL
jgi:hypothetical protein